MDISCKYSEHAVADSQQVIVHHTGSRIRGYEHVMKCYIEPQA